MIAGSLSGSLPRLAIPSTLHASLLARLDRLAPVTKVAQIGAVIGREFSHELLAAVAHRSEAELQAALDQVVASELVYRRGVPPEATYSFKHALVQETAYGTLLKSRRQQLHSRVAEVLAERALEPFETAPEIVAHHYAEAGLAQRAIEYLIQAGHQAIARWANAEAKGHLTKALTLLRGVPQSDERDRLEMELKLALGQATISLERSTASSTWAMFGPT